VTQARFVTGSIMDHVAVNFAVASVVAAYRIAARIEQAAGAPG